MFLIKEKKDLVRKGIIKTKSGDIKTPFFMPDATRGFIKSLSRNDLISVGMGPMVVNTFHLYLNPGIKTVKKSGGINKFMHWPYPLLSDSGGYQIFSLIHKNPKMGEITDKGAIFKSPVDGSKHILTPEKAIKIQFDLGVDMMVCLDDVPPHSFKKEKIEDAVRRTILWAGRCMKEYKRQLKLRKISFKKRPLIFCVIQGGVYLDLREKCAQELKKIGLSNKNGPAIPWDGYGFGARHVDQEGNFLEKMVKETAGMIPEQALRFALGVGTPEDILKFYNLGWDMFDCVIPTREGRHGRLFLKKKNLKVKEGFYYETININNEKFREDFSKIDEKCDCELCKNYSRAYLRHLFHSRDPLAMRLASLHNLKFYQDFMKNLRETVG
jgi:queuine tRNA-ribosyltransferase